ncbi:hypothetical protein [Providencia sp.]|uniref:HNH endonuclease n=1 Tax=Providencia sp. TaxID=589 RepID=UPI003341ED1D
MIKLSPPLIKCPDILAACLSSVSNTREGTEYINKFNLIKNKINAEWQLFDDRADTIDLHLFNYSRHAHKEQLVIDDVSKDDFVKLYTEYMVKGDTLPRSIYNTIRASSNNICPLCGISIVTTIDHYLPKARYPIFSIYTNNLVPACDTCNKGKGSSTYTSKESQPLHPYFSAPHFYATDWIKANVLKTSPLSFDFYADPPDHWDANDKARVINHFSDFNLAAKYSVNASQFLTLINNNMIQIILDSGGDSNAVKDVLVSSAAREKPNTTLRIILYAMADDDEICNGLYL